MIRNLVALSLLIAAVSAGYLGAAPYSAYNYAAAPAVGGYGYASPYSYSASPYAYSSPYYGGHSTYPLATSYANTYKYAYKSPIAYSGYHSPAYSSYSPYSYGASAYPYYGSYGSYVR